jgi:hypothetical protein
MTHLAVLFVCSLFDYDQKILVSFEAKACVYRCHALLLLNNRKMRNYRGWNLITEIQGRIIDTQCNNYLLQDRGGGCLCDAAVYGRNGCCVRTQARRKSHTHTSHP